MQLEEGLFSFNFRRPLSKFCGGKIILKQKGVAALKVFWKGGLGEEPFVSKDFPPATHSLYYKRFSSEKNTHFLNTPNSYMKNTTNIITVKNLHKAYTHNGAFSLHVDNFHVQRGELVALVGPSGCGKSTALDLLSTALEPDAHNDAENVSQFTFCPEELPIDILMLWKNAQLAKLAAVRQKYIGYVLQTGGLLPFLSGYDNIMLACAVQEHAEDIEHVAQILDIEHLLLKKPAQMSVGERQRFAIARALIHKPKLILADEPVASLDPYNAQLVLELFITEAKEKNISVVMVSHAPAIAKAAGFRLVQAHICRPHVKHTPQVEQTAAHDDTDNIHHEAHIHAYIDTHNEIHAQGLEISLQSRGKYDS